MLFVFIIVRTYVFILSILFISLHFNVMFLWIRTSQDQSKSCINCLCCSFPYYSNLAIRISLVKCRKLLLSIKMHKYSYFTISIFIWVLHNSLFWVLEQNLDISGLSAENCAMEMHAGWCEAAFKCSKMHVRARHLPNSVRFYITSVLLSCIYHWTPNFNTFYCVCTRKIQKCSYKWKFQYSCVKQSIY